MAPPKGRLTLLDTTERAEALAAQLYPSPRVGAPVRPEKPKRSKKTINPNLTLNIEPKG